ncbi:MAG TPA: hypothetical protein VN947_23375 [Polyangia bacterium]|nr:hypothetical protein [Polyangia bacterium]
MRLNPDDRLTMAATRFVRDAGDRARGEAVSARLCLQCGSALGVRRHLTSLRALAERRARIERHLLHTSSSAARLRRAADAALRALDAGSPARLTRALARVEELAQ